MNGFFATAAAAAALLGGAASASAQPAYGYGYGDLPPAPYAEAGAPPVVGASCGSNHFTIVGARAGVTVLGFDVGGSAHFSAPVDSGCWGGGEGVAYPARAYAPPPPPPQPAYGYAGYNYGGYGYEPPPPRAVYGYAPPCGCEAPPRW
jgi:hypothetical protein